MVKKRRNAFDKMNTLFFGKDLRITQGEPYTQVRPFDFSTYYPENDYIYVQDAPTENVIDIRSVGADVNCEDNSKFINEAIEFAAQRSGTVLISGGDYYSSTVIIKSNVTLFIEKGSAIVAKPDGKGYEKHSALIYANGASNIIVTGGGKIKGNGHLFGREPFAKENNTTPAPYIDVIEMRRDYRAQLRFAHPSKYGGPVAFYECSNITVHNLCIENSAYWTFKISNCSNVDISNFIINNNRNVANADGIDLAGCDNVNVNHCFISTADDGIVIKNACWLGNKNAMSGITVVDCEIISRTNCVKIGTETTYDISNVTISDCKLFMTDLYPGCVSGISIEACDGSAVSNVRIHNVEMDRCTCPIFIRLGNRNRASLVTGESSNAIEFGKKGKKGKSVSKKLFNHKSSISDIIITDIKAENVEIPIIIAGYKQRTIVRRVENVTFKNIELTYVNIPETIDRRAFIPEYTKEYPEGWRFRNLPAYALWSRHTKNIVFENFKCTHPQKTYKKEIITIDAQ